MAPTRSGMEKAQMSRIWPKGNPGNFRINLGHGKAEIDEIHLTSFPGPGYDRSP